MKAKMAVRSGICAEWFGHDANIGAVNPIHVCKADKLH
jgi:hypothetical protein